MDSNKIFIIVFVCIAVICPVKETSAGKSKHADEGPCDTCPRKGKCVPKVSCPAHVRLGSKNTECHLKGDLIGVCCYTGCRHAAPSDHAKLSRSVKHKESSRMKAYNESRVKWSHWCRRAERTMDTAENTVASPESPDYGVHLTLVKPSAEATRRGEGALLNLFAVQDMKKRQAIDDEELALGYGEDETGPYCPPQPSCSEPPSPYRPITGECTNPAHPTWGAANSGYERLLPPDYSDGIWAFRTAKSGNPLPSARLVSTTLLLDGDFPSDSHNVMFMQTCQFIVHDLSASVTFTHKDGSFISCCTKEGGWLPPHQLHPACAPIEIPTDDDFFSHFNRTCHNFVRTQLAPSPDCSCGYAKQMNGATPLLDLSQIYGTTEEKKNSLRAPGGYLKVFRDYGRDLPPLTDRQECLYPQDKGVCFDSGDQHANQVLTLTGLHTVFTRAHNRIVSELAQHNPDCDEDTLYYSSRRLLQAIYQHIVYNEWLPLLIGPDLVKAFGLHTTSGYSECYDPEVNPALVTEFAAAAMRLHSSVISNVKVVSPLNDETFENVFISEMMFQPSRLRILKYYDRMLYGMLKEPMQKIDPFFNSGMTRYMFRGTNAFGVDIASINIQRGRDFGVPGYNHYRKLCGLRPKRRFEEFPHSASKRLSCVYECPDDIDLWIGGLMEEPVKGGVVGPTFANIIAEQFSRLKKGDPYFYQHGSDVNPGAFTPNELHELKKCTMARLLCDNADGIELTSMPPYAFLLGNQSGNCPLQCDDYAIPKLDFSKFTVC